MMSELSKRELQAMQVLRDHAARGIGPRFVAAKMGLGQSRTAEILRALRKRGLAEPTRPGQGAVWSTTERAEELRQIERYKREQRDRARALCNLDHVVAWRPVAQRSS